MNSFSRLVLWALPLFLVLSPPALASNNVVKVGQLDLDGVSSRVWLHNNRLYVASNAERGSLQVVNIDDPQHPFRIGSIYTSGAPQSALFQGNLLYVASETRFSIIDLTAVEPRRIGAKGYNDPNTNVGIIVEGGWVYLLEGVEGNRRDVCTVKRMNIADPQNIGNVLDGFNWQNEDRFDYKFLDWVQVGDDIFAISKRLSAGQLVAGYNGIGRIVLDAGNPPRFMDAFEMDHDPKAIAARDNILYTGGGYFDVSDPENPEQVSHELSSATRTVIDGDFFYSAYGEGGFAIKYIDEEGRVRLRSVGNYRDIGAVSLDIAVKGDYVFEAAGEEGLKVYHYPRDRQSIYFYGHNLTFGTLAVGESATIDLRITNDGFGPLEIGRMWLSPGIMELDNEGDFVLEAGESRVINVTFQALEQVANARDTLWIESNDIDGISRAIFRGSSTNVRTRSSLQIGNNYGTNGYTIVGGVAFALTNGLTSIALENRDELRVISSLNAGGGAFLHYENDLLYVVGGDELKVIDISDPANMAIIGTLEHWEFNGRIDGLAVVGTKAVIVRKNDNPGAVVIDVEDPENMRVTGRLLNESTDGVASRGHLLFIFKYDMKIWDFTDPDDPELVATLNNPREGERWGGITFGDDYAYVSDSYYSRRSVDIVDLSDIENPQIVGSFETIDQGIYRSNFAGRHLITSTGYGTAFYDLIDPIHPREVLRFNPPDNASLLEPLGDGLFFGGMAGNFRVFDMNSAIGIFGENPGQRVELARNWNLISLNVAPDERYWADDRGPSVPLMAMQWQTFRDFSQLVFIKDGRGNFHHPVRGFDNIPFWNPNEAYWVKMTGRATGAWDGAPIDPQTEIALRNGVNLVAYLPDYELDMSAPNFAGIAPIRDHVVLMKNGDGQFAIPAQNFSSIEKLSPGEGYVMKMDQSVAFTYPEAGEGRLAGVPTAKARQPLNTGSSMSVLLKFQEPGLLPANALVKAYTASGRWVGAGAIDASGSAGVPVWGDDPTTEDVDGAVDGEVLIYKLVNITNQIMLNVEWTGGTPAYQTDGYALGNVTGSDFFLHSSSFSLSPPFPNPFNSSTTITFSLSPPAGRGGIQGGVRLAIYDLSGRLVTDLLNRRGVLQYAPTAGTHKVVWDAGDQPAGVYLVRLEAKGQSRTQKIVLMR